MQCPSIMAFRKRFKKRGYQDVSIKLDKGSGNYVVTAVEPLARVAVSCEYTEVAMYNSFRF